MKLISCTLANSSIPHRYRTSRSKHSPVATVPSKIRNASVIRRFVLSFLRQDVASILRIFIMVDMSRLSLVVFELFLGCKQCCGVRFEVGMARVRWVSVRVRLLTYCNPLSHCIYCAQQFGLSSEIPSIRRKCPHSRENIHLSRFLWSKSEIASNTPSNFLSSLGSTCATGMVA